MCNDCKIANSENVFVSDKISNKIKKVLLNNLLLYKYRFNISKKMEIKPSERHDKRFALFVDDFKKADFGFAQTINGRKKYAETFIDLIDSNPKYAKEKQRLYKKRAMDIVDGLGERTYDKSYTPNSLSYWLLWHCKNCQK